MCKFCSNQDNTKSKFRLFDIKPIPFFIPSKSFAYSSGPQETPDISTQTIRPQETPDTSTQTIRSQETLDTSTQTTRPQETPDTSTQTIRSQETLDTSTQTIRSQETPDTSTQTIRFQETPDISTQTIRPQETPDTSTQTIRSKKNTGISAKSSKNQKSSRVLLKLSDTFNTSLTSKKFILLQDNSQLLLNQKESYYQIDTSNNIEEIKIEIKKLLYDYQLINLYIVLFLEGIHIKGFILHISEELVTIIGPNLKVESNSADNIIESPNRITIKIEMIQAIGDAETPLKLR
ncbi:hypothetical protein [Bacillus wiedmannii]|uniref:Uncharacterized protein n=1 Tax=Bacillus wiedmannii TaxID=1890302 RepID=A0A1C4DKD3_9BACI|nr:hypothetical protein [Bacillus wiedmannii]SCC31798.1 Uncharacterized protein BC05F1_02731 [Bacillus wiedmannii]